MTQRHSADRRCSYVVVLDDPSVGAGDVRNLAAYLSTVSVAGCEIVIIDDTERFERNRRVLRWVGRHLAALPRHRSITGSVDAVRAACDLAACEKVIVASPRARYTAAQLDEICSLLEEHEVVEPQDYCDPLPWWGGIDAGRVLVHRGIEPLPDHGATFGFRRSVVRGLRSLDSLELAGDDAVRRLQSVGAEIRSPDDLFVRCEPPSIGSWLRDRARQAGDDFSMPVKTAFFFAMIPLITLLASFGGARLAGSYAGAVAGVSLLLAVRGRSGASGVFPLRACLFAPLWILERSVSVYWALLRKMSGGGGEPRHVPVSDGAGGQKVASGE